MTPGYLTVASFKDRTIMPGFLVDQLESSNPGWLQRRLDEESGRFNARFKKLYAVPFDTASPPSAIDRWLTEIVTQDAYNKLGRPQATDQDKSAIDDPADRARAEVLEASNAKDGLFDLPLREDNGGSSAMVSGGPLGQSEVSPYCWIDVEREALP